MSIFAKLLLLVLVVAHLLVGGGAFVSCVEQDGARTTELALSLCCERTTHEAPSAPVPSITGTDDDCGACVDELIGDTASRPSGETSCLVIPPATLPDATLEVALAPVAPPVELASSPPGATPRRTRPAQLRP